MTAKIKGITWQVDPPYLIKLTDDKKRKNKELKIDGDLSRAYSYIAKYHGIEEKEVIKTFKGA